MASAPKVHLFDVHQFACEAQRFLGQQDVLTFRDDLKGQRAIAYCLLSLARALERIETENPGLLRAEVSSELQWSRFRQLYRFLGRGIDRVEADSLRRTVLDDVPPLIAVTAQYLSKHRGD